MPQPAENIAITDFEFTGLDPVRHEIIEIGLIVIDSKTLAEINHFETRVKPEHIESAVQESIAVAGYNEKDWQDALTLPEALTKYVEVAQNSIFAAWGTPYDWIFLLEAFKKTNIKNPFDYRTIDLFTVAYEKLRNSPDVTHMGLATLCQYFGIPKEPMPHRAINGARSAFELYKKLRAL